MKKIIVVYASMTGNTQDMAEAIAEGLREIGGEVTVKDAFDANASEFLEYDGIVLGAYTWGDGDLPDEFLDFYEEMDGLDLQGKPGAAFGSGDTSYSLFCAAVDTIQAKLRKLGSDLKLDGLKLELSPSSEEREQCREFGRSFMRQVLSQQ
ncbi:flavodoxin [Paenibacillus sp. MBLB4367]|uniref:flavodoxin n=1 Tax=Paenibacillus sp. MBLB4367 TaxID=3384767 RepID=UPI0039082941